MIPITDKLFFIEGKSKGRYIFSNSLFIDDEKKAIIDTGVGKSILRKLKKHYLVNNELTIMNTHCHEDHIGGNSFFKNSRTCIHHLEAPIVRDFKKLITLYGMEDPKFDEINDSFYAVFGLKNCDVAIEFDAGYKFNFGDTNFDVIHTPGHSAGHCCFYEPKEKILFLGDIDLSSFGPWYGDTSSSVNDYIDSINQVIKLNPKIAISSHKGIYADGIKEELKKFLEKIYQREEKILDFLKTKKTFDEIIKKAIIYGKFPEPIEMFEVCEMIMINLHLQRLLHAKKIEEQPKNTFKAI